MSNLTQNVYTLGYNTGHTLRQLLLSSTALPHHPLPTTNPLTTILTFPRLYKEWWMKLVHDDPIHVLIETLLILFVIYMLVFKRAADWKMEMKDKLSDEERYVLLKEWKPAPLAPELSVGERRMLERREGVVVTSVAGPYVTIRGRLLDCHDDNDDHDHHHHRRRLLNLTSHDFLGLSSHPSVKSTSRATLQAYGCGACGPRGFYGTIDVHLDLEREMAQFCRTDAAIMYSDGASAVTSTVAAFAKRGDLIVVDEGVYESLMTGVMLSRANVKVFKHNDMDDLKDVLQTIAQSDAKNNRKSSLQRRFIIIEALYKNYGHIAPLDDIISLKNEFAYRLIVDESYSFGVLGANGRGVTELYDKTIMHDVEIVTISLENSLGSVGGVTVGNFEVVDHQRLSGAGYCFSAAVPPFLARAAMESLRLLQKEGRDSSSSREGLLGRLNESRSYLYERLRGLEGVLVVLSDELSPMAFVTLDNYTQTTTAAAALSGEEQQQREKEERVLDDIAEFCKENGVLLTSTTHVKEHLNVLPPPSLRMTVTANHKREHIDLAVDVLQRAIEAVLGSEKMNV